jgi:hypothetical protein
MGILTDVRGLTKSVAMLLLALWMPVTMHCELEIMPGFSFLQWCCGGGHASAQAHDCGQDSCGEVESGFYKIEDHTTVIPGLALVLALAAWDWVDEPLADTAPDFLPISSAPPGLPRFWQFFYRTALPPRAPSLVA